MLWLTKGWARQVAIREAFLKMTFKKISNRLNCNHWKCVLRKKETSGIDGVGGRNDSMHTGLSKIRHLDLELKPA